MNKLKVVNIKCGGCAKTIETELTKNGFSAVNVDPNCQEVEFEGDSEKAKKILEKMGYPEEGSEAAKSILLKSKSYISCMRGKIKK